MLILALIGADPGSSPAWSALSLCVMARRGDEAMAVALATVAQQPAQEVSFVGDVRRGPEAIPGAGRTARGHVAALSRLGRRRREVDDLELHQRRAVGDCPLLSARGLRVPAGERGRLTQSWKSSSVSQWVTTK